MLHRRVCVRAKQAFSIKEGFLDQRVNKRCLVEIIKLFWKRLNHERGGAEDITTSVHLCTYTCMSSCMYACMYTYVCMYVYMHVFMYACIHIGKPSPDFLTGFPYLASSQKMFFLSTWATPRNAHILSENSRLINPPARPHVPKPPQT